MATVPDKGLMQVVFKDMFYANVANMQPEFVQIYFQPIS